ncbi:MAG TPA: hypothetical protein VKB56_05560 [Terriglobales bacterium]|nr:hypothetical protein [Terriglobales bacterium]
MKKTCLVALLFSASLAFAHIGTNNVYFDGYAGPYHLLVTVQPPVVIPGVADIQIRVLTPGVSELRIVPMRIVGQGSDMAPVPDVAQKSSDDPQLYTGRLWIMLRGSWKVRIDASGTQGPAQLSVPIAAVSQFPLPMRRYLGALLTVLGLLLVVGLISIIGASVREASLKPGAVAGDKTRRKARIAMASATVVVIAILWLSNSWWNAEAASNRRSVYRTPPVTVKLEGNQLQLHLENPNGANWAEPLRLNDLVPDHGHLMHLFLVRMPQMDAFEHLHPQQIELGNFVQQASALPEGHYKIFADVVHSTGFPETYVGNLDLPSITSPASGDADDSGRQSAQPAGESSDLGDNDRMIWEKPSELRANQLLSLRFRVVDKNGVPATDLEPYMGMAGHAVIISTDGNVFAHVHPSGSVPMVSVELAQTGHLPPTDTAARAVMPGMTPSAHMTPEVSFPWGFPRVGTYRVFVQVKRAGHVDTGVFEADVR